MSIWSTDFLNRVALEAEEFIAREIPCIIARTSLESFPGVGLYSLPDYVHNVRRVFWKGKRLEPRRNYSETEFRYITGAFLPQAFSGGFEIGNGNTALVGLIPGGFITEGFTAAFHTEIRPSASAGGSPLEYFYNGFGENYVQLFPDGNEYLPAYSSGLFGENIANSLIIEYYRVPDGVDWTLPEYIRRRTIKSYVLWRAFEKEGDGQNLQAAEYHQKRFLVNLERARSIINNIYKAQANIRTGESSNEIRRVARPVLPWNYGVTVEDYDD